MASELDELHGRVEVRQLRAHTAVGEDTDVGPAEQLLNKQIGCGPTVSGIFGATSSETSAISSLWTRQCNGYMQPLAWLLQGGLRSSQWPVLGASTPRPSRQSNRGTSRSVRNNLARRYGSRVLSALETWTQSLLWEPDNMVSTRWVSVFQLMCSYILIETARLWYEPDTRAHSGLVDVNAATLTHWFGRLLRAYVESTGGRYSSRDIRPDSTCLQVKLRCVAVPWPASTSSMVEAYISSRCPAQSVAGGHGHGPICGSDHSKEGKAPSALAAGARRLQSAKWFGHGCSGHRMISEHEPE